MERNPEKEFPTLSSNVFIDERPCMKSQHPWRIALISALILILELTFIRIIPAEVRAISYFTNLILMATFFGMGVGCILQEKWSLSWLMPLGLLLVFAFTFIGRGIVIYPEAKEAHYFLQYSDIEGPAFKLPMFPASVMIFVFAALPFATLGQALSRAMEPFPRLTAYGWNIAGSLAGTLSFVLCSLLYIPPWIWPPVLTLIWSLLFVQSKLKKMIYALSGIVFISLLISPYTSSWSPYYFIQHEVNRGITIWVNSSFHQRGIDFLSKDPKERKVNLHLFKKWNYPYDLYRKLHDGKPPERVLVLGSGTGNDVNMALFNDVSEIVAVEIDPVILSLGKKYNSMKPYSAKNVQTHVDDARHYLRTAQEKFDMIIFGTLDSQTLLSSQANLRLENYVYTSESLEDAKHLLSDKGMVAIYYCVFKPWLWNRLYATLREAFGEHSAIYFDKSNMLFNTLLVGTKGIDDFHDIPEYVDLFAKGIPSTDNWPFIYLERPTVSPLYWKLFAVIFCLILGVFFLLRKIHRVTGLHANFLLLGLGFTLMESSAIVRLSLLFGSTWVINALVFSSVLLTIFFANLVVLKKKSPPLWVAWICLSLFVLINYFFPVAWLLEFGTMLRIFLCGLLIGIPVFFAAVCFSCLFEKEQVTGYPLGINLIGAMAGGVIEYSSMAIGMKKVWLIVFVIYLLAWISTNLIDRRT